MGLTKRLMEDEMESMEEFDPPKHLTAEEGPLSSALREEMDELERRMEELRELEAKATSHSRPVGRAAKGHTSSGPSMPWPVARIPSTPVAPTPPPATDITKELRGMAEVEKASIEVSKYIKDKGVSSGEFLDRNCEKVTPLYRYLKDDAASIVATASVIEGVKTGMTLAAKKMSGAATTVPLELHPVIASAIFGNGIPEMSVVSSSFRVIGHFKIGEDLKLKMYYKVVSFEPTPKLDSYITLLDPDLML